ncbi:MAG: hypothetical protein ACK5PG_17635 [Lysobacterales bacterium]|jgi:hypothetical protein
MREILERFDELASRLERGELEGAAEALAEHDRAVRSAFASPQPIDEAIARSLLARQHRVHSLMLALRDQLGERLGNERRGHTAVNHYLMDSGG